MNAFTIELAARTVTGPFVAGVAHTGTEVVVVLRTTVVDERTAAVVSGGAVDDDAIVGSTTDEVVETVAAPPPHEARRSIPIKSDRTDRDPSIGQPPR